MSLTELAPIDPSQSPITVGIAGVGRAVPPGRLYNSELSERLGVDEEWIRKRTGIHSRGRADGQRVSELSTDAARAALADAGVDAADLDLVLVATVAADEITPAAAPLVAHEIGAERAGAIDINAACTGSLSALALACGQIEARRAEKVLVVGAEVMSRFIDMDDRSTAILFGDGAGALVLSAGGGGWVGPVVLRSDGGSRDLIVIQHGGNVEMKGHETFKRAVIEMSAAGLQALSLVGMDPSEVDLFVFHQANARILHAVTERLELEPDRVLDCIAEIGNTSAASIPLALAEAHAQGRLTSGAKILLGAMGAGLTWGAAVLEWP
ncbi:MAG TPA: beta-ketoacyl-ACP synthase 3 [Solirubrobacteraceae bacterium]|nr:beta-ketoacyl-ACP synthase 3 [Solirubrobacteraceae bacterium]